MDVCLEDNLFFYKREQNIVSLVAGEKSRFLNNKSVYLNEIIIAKEYRKQGFAPNILGGFINNI